MILKYSSKWYSTKIQFMSSKKKKIEIYILINIQTPLNRKLNRISWIHSPTTIKIVIKPKSVSWCIISRRIVSGGWLSVGRWCCWRIKLSGVWIISRMFELAMGPQVITPSVRRPAEWTLESTREVHVVMVSYVGHYFSA